MTDRSPSRNAFSDEYRASLREQDEPDGPWADDAAKPLEIRDVGGRFGLFHPWQDPGSGDEPVALFSGLDDARLALLARTALRRTQYYRLHKPQDEPESGGYAVLREGEVTGALRTYEPEWVDVMNVLALTAQSPESLAAMLDLAGPTTQDEVGEILGRGIQLKPRPDERGGTGTPEG
ncbi:MAG TPA: hypothetical protein VHC97_05035 [Thermoanaerobaculia bacterium]|jgi:hypothetical protein|nr:hypothetical protein [Thermoanaerobaculia bacterium]